MLDLKAKLAAAGLVSKEDVARAEQSRGRERGGGKPAPQQPKRPSVPVASLRGKPKGEIYDAVRKVVERVRLDVVGATPTEDAAAYHFPSPTGRIGRLTLEPAVAGALGDGSAALVSYMSNHGLAHAVVPAEVGREIAELMPLWLRVLVGDARAGQIEKPADKPAP